ncbi:MAG: hypothetical protein K2X98_01960 [Alphaproteobacteria bacterium]|nr:hypothetical protein [Alphaproteobacteria bacterium]
MKKATLAMILLTSIFSPTHLLAMDDAPLENKTKAQSLYSLQQRITWVIGHGVTETSAMFDEQRAMEKGIKDFKPDVFYIFFDSPDTDPIHGVKKEAPITLIKQLRHELSAIGTRSDKGIEPSDDEGKRFSSFIYTDAKDTKVKSFALWGIGDGAYQKSEAEGSPPILIDEKSAVFYVSELKRSTQPYLAEKNHVVNLENLARTGFEPAMELWHHTFGVGHSDTVLQGKDDGPGVPIGDKARVQHLCDALLKGESVYTDESLIRPLIEGSGNPEKRTGIFDFLPHPKAQQFIASVLTTSIGTEKVQQVLTRLLIEKGMVLEDQTLGDQMISHLALSAHTKGEDSYSYYGALAMHYLNARTSLMDQLRDIDTLLTTLELSKNNDGAQAVRNIKAVALSRLTGNNLPVTPAQRGEQLRALLFPDNPSTKVPNTAQMYWVTVLKGTIKLFWDAAYKNTKLETYDDDMAYAVHFGTTGASEVETWNELFILANEANNPTAQHAILDLLRSTPSERNKETYAHYANFLDYHYTTMKLI